MIKGIWIALCAASMMLGALLLPLPEHSPAAPQTPSPPLSNLEESLIRLLAERMQWEHVPSPQAIELEAPREAPPPPPPDPALELRKHHLKGVVSTNRLKIALLEKEGELYQLSVGDQIAGFTLMTIEQSEVTFEQTGSTITLSLN